MALRAVLFDKDGTLVDFHRTWMGPYRVAADELASRAGEPALAARLMAEGGYHEASNSFLPDSPLASGTNRTIAGHWAPLLAEAGFAVDVAVLRRLLDGIFARSLEPAPVLGLHELLSRLRARGLPLGVATMDSEASAHETLEQIAAGAFFDFVCGCDSGHGEKPEPGMVLAFARAVGVPPAEVVMVGDSPRDLAMGRAAGAGLCIGVLTGASARSALEPLADRVLDSVAALEDVLDGRTP